MHILLKFASFPQFLEHHQIFDDRFHLLDDLLRIFSQICCTCRGWHQVGLVVSQLRQKARKSLDKPFQTLLNAHEPRKKKILPLSMKCWFVDRDHYFMFYDNPRYKNNKGPFFIADLNKYIIYIYVYLESMAFLEDHGKA